MNSRKKLFLLVALFYTLYIIFPLLGDVVRFPVWLPSIVTSALLFYLYPHAFQNKTIYWFIAYAAVLALFVLIGKPLTIGIGTVRDSKKILIEFAYILPTLGLFSIFGYLKDYKLSKKYVLWSIVILYASFVVALPLMLRYNSLRAALTEVGGELVIPGLPGYSLMHAYTLFLPALCYAINLYHKRMNWYIIICVLLLCYVIYSTFVTTSLLIMITIILFSVLYKDKRRSLFWILMIAAFFFLYLMYEAGLFISFIDLIIPYFEHTPVERKLLDFRTSLMEGQMVGGSITGRQYLHSISWNSFLENPLWGTSKVGRHSSLLDRFGGMGIIGGIPFVMIFIEFFKSSRKLFITKRARSYFSIGTFAAFLYLYEKGNWGCESWFMYMIMMPMTIWVFENSNQLKNRRAS